MSEKDDKERRDGSGLNPLRYEPDGKGSFQATPREEDEAVNIAMEQAWEEVERKVDKARERVRKEERSPLAFFMELNMMDPKTIARYMGSSKRKVKQHLRPKGFQRIDASTMNAYADLFGIELDELRDPDLSRTASPFKKDP